MVTHSSFPAWEIPWTEEFGELAKESDMTMHSLGTIQGLE